MECEHNWKDWEMVWHNKGDWGYAGSGFEKSTPGEIFLARWCLKCGELETRSHKIKKEMTEDELKAFGVILRKAA